MSFGVARRARGQSGYTIFELLVALAFVGILAGSATFQARALTDPLQNQTAMTLSFIKRVRARAIASTSSYLIYPSAGTHLNVARGVACPTTMPAIPSTLVPGTFTLDNLKLDLSEQVQFSSPNWGVCFTSRGLLAGSANVQLLDNEARTKTITIYLGGATRIQ